jgi:hypothetical protein
LNGPTAPNSQNTTSTTVSNTASNTVPTGESA